VRRHDAALLFQNLHYIHRDDLLEEQSGVVPPHSKIIQLSPDFG
jgi:hypothetical protein